MRARVEQSLVLWAGDEAGIEVAAENEAGVVMRTGEVETEIWAGTGSNEAGCKEAGRRSELGAGAGCSGIANATGREVWFEIVPEAGKEAGLANETEAGAGVEAGIWEQPGLEQKVSP